MLAYAADLYLLSTHKNGITLLCRSVKVALSSIRWISLGFGA